MNALNRSEVNNNIVYYQPKISKDTITARYRLQEQKKFFNSGKTRDINIRRENLIKLRDAIKNNEAAILKALNDDLKKSSSEAFVTEIMPVLKEISHALSNIKKWSRAVKVKTPVYILPAKSYIVPEPYGQALIIGPWNYPFQLNISPLVGAIAAGNTAVIKPSELALNTSRIIAKVISEAFDPSYVTVVEGDAEITRFLLSEGFDYIFFTGGTETGKIIMREAANNLTPVTLELGGKSPVIVDSDASIEIAAKKIVWGKFLNSGQTCIAPDYVLVHRDVKEELVKKMMEYIGEFYGQNPKDSPDYSRIINISHYKRIKDLMKYGRIIFGGETSEKTLFISPTLIDSVSLNSPLMSGEIFGPLLPIIEFNDINEAVSTVKSKPKPLVLYLFSKSSTVQKKVQDQISSGGLVINDVLLHIGNYYLPFGGVGASGMGSYHGKFGFNTFSHMKAVMNRSRSINIKIFYPPYRMGMKLMKILFK